MKKLFIIFLFFLLAQSAWAATKVIIKDYPPQIYPNQEFDVNFNIINDFISSDSYYAKGRVGSSSASLNKGETYNPITDNWFSDTLSWSNFPIIKFNNDTIATASVKLRANQTVSIGNNSLVIRINKNGNYDSSPSALLIIEPRIIVTPTITPTIGSDDPTPTTTIPVSYDNIYISEVMANPPSGEKEWVEIYNDNDSAASLKNWAVDDSENAGSSPKIFSLEIPAKSYGIFDLNSSIFNNDGDSVRLLDSNKNLKDDFEYGETETGKTLGRTSFDSDDFCLQEPSKNSANNSCIVQTPNLGVSTTLAPTLTPTGLISINQSIDTKIPIETKGLGTVLGTSDKLIINTPNNKPLINLLSFFSCFYSLLVIVSILIKSKVLKKYALAS